jgi:heme exporter protein B
MRIKIIPLRFMQLLKEIKYLIQKEIQLEWRQKYAFNGLLLYVISTIYICYLSFKTIIDPATWNALFWIIMLFAAVNAVAKSFLQEGEGRLLYYYTLVNPQGIILSKIAYNALLMLVLSGINMAFYSLLIGNIVQDMPLYLISMLLGSLGFSSILTMVSAIASKAGKNGTLMAILSFPLLIPLLITIIKLSKNAIDGLDWSVSYQYIIILAALNCMVVALSVVLFPYLWRD